MTASRLHHAGRSPASLARFTLGLTMFLLVTLLLSAGAIGRAAPLAAEPDGPALANDEVAPAGGLAAPPGWSDPIPYTVTGMQTPNGLAVDSYHHRLYITSRDNNRLLMLDTATMQVLRQATVGPLPWGVAVSPGANRVYVANFGNGTMSVLDATSLASLATIDFGAGSQPALVGWLFDQLVVALHGLNKFALINSADGALVGTVSTGGKGMWGLAADATRRRVFIGFRDSGEVKVFDEWLFWWWWVTPSGGTVKPCGATGSPYGLAYASEVQKLFVSCASTAGGSVDTAVIYSVSGAGKLTELARNPLDPGGSNGGMVALGNWGNVFFANSASGTISVIGDYSNQVVARLTTGGDPFGIAVDRLYRTVYVGDRGGNRVLVFPDSSVASLRGGNGIAADPGSGKLYVTSRDNGMVLMLNGTTHWTDAVLTIGGRPWGIAINPGTRRVYAAGFDTNKLAVINAGGMELITAIPVGIHSTFVDVNRSTNRVFVVNHDNNLLWVINGETNTVLRSLPTGGGKGAWGLAVNPRLNRVYVAHRDSGELVTFDGTNDRWTLLDDQTVRGCRRGLPYGVGFNPVNNEVYVTCATGMRPNADVNHVDIYSAEADGLKWRVELPLGHGGDDGGGGIAVDTATGNVLFTNSAENTVTIIGRNNHVLKTMYVGLDPFGATANPNTRVFHVALRLGNNVINIPDTLSDPYRSYLPLIAR